MVMSMRDLERTWNSKFNYPWTFFNDKPFTEEFKRKTRAATKAKINYGRILVTRKEDMYTDSLARNHPRRTLEDAILD